MKVLHFARILDRPTGPGYSVPKLLEAQRPFLSPCLVSIHGERTKPLEGLPYPTACLKDLVKDPGAVFAPPFDRPSLAVFHGCFYPAYVPLARHLRAQGIPYVITPRGTFQKEALRRKAIKKWLGIQLLFKPFILGASALHFLTPDEREGSETWGLSSFVVPNGIDPCPTALRAKPGKNKGLTFGFLGRVDTRHKGLDLLAEAVALVQGDLRKAKVKVPVYGPDHEGTSGELEKLIRRLGVSDLMPLKGTVRGREKDMALKGFDLFLHPSRHEGLPISVLEALARGIPCLVTPGTNLMGEVRKAGCGFAVEGTKEAIAQALRSALADPKGLADKGAKALALSRRYDWREVGRESVRFYRELVRGREFHEKGTSRDAEGKGGGR